MPLVASKQTNNTACSIVSISQNATIGTFPLVLTRQVSGGYAPSSVAFGMGSAALADAAGSNRLPNGAFSLRIVSADAMNATFSLYDVRSNLARYTVTWTIGGVPNSPAPAGSYLQIIDANNGTELRYNEPNGEIFVGISTLTDGVHNVSLKTADGNIWSTAQTKTKGGKAYNRITENFTHDLMLDPESKTITTRDTWPFAGDQRGIRITFSGSPWGAADVYQDFTVEAQTVSYSWTFAGDVTSPMFGTWPGADQALASPSAGTLTIRPAAQAPAAGGTDDVVIAQVANPPNPPTGFSFTMLAANRTRFNWSHDGANVGGFRIYHVPTMGNPLEVTPPGGLPAADREFTLSPITYGATYRVVAFNGDGESSGNPEVTLPTVTGLTAAPPIMDLVDGETGQINATASFSSGQSFDATSLASYNVGNDGTGGPGSISVSSSGLVAALNETVGATVGVAFQGYTQQVTVNVAPPPMPPPGAPVISYDRAIQHISWGLVANATEYAVLRNGMEVPGGHVANSPYIIPTELGPNYWPPGTYDVHLVAIGPGGISPESNHVTVIITEAPRVVVIGRDRFQSDPLRFFPFEPSAMEEAPGNFVSRSPLPAETIDYATQAKPAAPVAETLDYFPEVRIHDPTG